MTITKIVPITTSRSQVFIDEEFAFVLYKGELRSYKLRENEEMSEETYHEIIHTILPKRAKLRCMNLLKQREYTEWQLKNKLTLGGYSEEIVKEALDYVKSYHYVDDYGYCIRYITIQSATKGKQRLMQELMRKGVSKELILQAYEEAMQSGEVTAEDELIKKYMEKKHYDPKTADEKERQRLYAFLFRKGFHMEQIRKALDITSFCV